MDRRELLKLIVAATGCVMIGMPKLGYSYDSPLGANNDFSTGEVALLDEIAETIISRTDTPGAKDAACGLCMAQVVADCYSPEEQAQFCNGLAAFNERTNGRFMEMTLEERATLFRTLHAELKAPDTEGGARKPHYFTMFKQLTLWTFFSSEVGAKQVLRYVAVPGRFEEIAYEPGMKAWAT